MSASSAAAASAAQERPSEDDQTYDSTPNTTPPTLDDIDRWQCHIGLQEFGESLEAAAKAVFPNDSKSRYTQVFVLMLCWDDEDPQLPVSLEIKRLQEVFTNVYHFKTEVWKIPDVPNCHAKLNQKILDFVSMGNDSTEHLKIVYYAGHAGLTKNRLLTWSSWRFNQMSKCPTVKWSGIQNALEEAQSDVLILLDCCASGAINTLEGNGVTELVAACGYNAIALGVGQYSFTSELILELLDLSNRPSFTIAYLYNNIFCRIQGRIPEDGRERHPPPIHLVLTQDNHFPRSIQLSKCTGMEHSVEENPSPEARVKQPEGRGGAVPKPSSVPDSTQSSSRDDESFRIESMASAMPKVPRLAFAIRLQDSIKPNQLRTDLFLEWLRTMPAVAEEVKVEAGFASFSSLVIISIPMALAAFLPWNRAIISLGPISSSNQVIQQKSLRKKPRVIHSGRYTDRHEGVQVDIIPNQNSKRSRDGRPGPVYHIGERLPLESKLISRHRPNRAAPSMKPISQVLGKLPEAEAPHLPSDIIIMSPNSPQDALVSGRRSNTISENKKQANRQLGQFLPSPPSSHEGSPAPSHDELSEGSEDGDKHNQAPSEPSKIRSSFASSFFQKLSRRSGDGARGN